MYIREAAKKVLLLMGIGQQVRIFCGIGLNWQGRSFWKKNTAGLINWLKACKKILPFRPNSKAVISVVYRVNKKKVLL